MAETNATDSGLPHREPTTPKRFITIKLEVAADFEQRHDWRDVIVHEIRADRWSWDWKEDNASEACEPKCLKPILQLPIEYPKEFLKKFEAAGYLVVPYPGEPRILSAVEQMLTKQQILDFIELKEELRSRSPLVP